jgi:hypothetical protein
MASIVLAELGIALQLLLRLGDGLLGRGVEGVALLPEELPVAQEGAGGLLPAQHGAPLVIEHGQVPPGVDDPAPVVAEQRLGGGADAQPLLQLLAAAHGDPGALGGEALHMVLLLLQQETPGSAAAWRRWSWPVFLNSPSRMFWIFSQMA